MYTVHVYTLFATVFTAITLVCRMIVVSYKPSYGLRLFIVVLQELHCLLNCLHDQS